MASIGKISAVVGRQGAKQKENGSVLFTGFSSRHGISFTNHGNLGNKRTFVTLRLRQENTNVKRTVDAIRHISSATTSESRNLMLPSSMNTLNGLIKSHRSISLPYQASPFRIVLSSNANGQIRTMMAEGEGGGADKNKAKSSPLDDGSGDSTELATLTPGEKVVVGTRLLMWTGILGFASVCAYFIARELLPGKMSPNVIFDKAFAVVKDHPEIGRKFGEPLKAYGRDHGGHREGRRNFIEHSQYTDKDDGSKRTRVRFNIEGQYGQAFVFAEVSSDMDSGEFVYVIVQDKRNGQVTTLVDNRAAMTARRMAGGSKEGQEAFGNLLGGFKRS